MAMESESQQGQALDRHTGGQEPTDILLASALPRETSELARAAVDHQTSVAPSKRTVDLTSKSMDANKPIACANPSSVPVHRSSSSADWALAAAEDKKDWFLAAAAAAAPREEALVAAGRPPPTQPPALATESSTGASSEENLPSVSDIGVSEDSAGSGGHGGGGSGGGSDGGSGSRREGAEAEPLRIWTPGAGTLSRESPTADVAFMAEGNGDSTSPPRSAESDVELISPKGFWREDFETIDARNATRRFSGWEDGASGREGSPGEGVSRPGGGSREGSGGGCSRADRAGGGRPPLRKDGGNPTALEDQIAPAPGGLGMGVKIGRKLFSSPEKPPPPPRRKTPPLAAKPSKNSSARPSAGGTLEAMVEGDHESPSPMGPPGGGPHPPPFWATPVEPARGAGAGGKGVRAEEKDGAAGPGAGLGWRRGEAGLVIPEPLPQPKSRSVTIQSVVPQRASRMGGEAQQGGGGGGGGSSGSGDAKRPLAAPRPATTSPTLPAAGEHKSKVPKELRQVLTPGVKIVRSYSYHGLGSIALYDSAKRG